MGDSSVYSDFFRGRWVHVEIQRRALLMSAAVFAGRYARFLAECAVERADTLKAAAEGNLLHSLVCERQSPHGGGYAQAFQVGVEAHADLVVANAGKLELRQPQMLRCLRERDGVVEILVQVFQHLCFLGHGELFAPRWGARASNSRPSSISSRPVCTSRFALRSSGISMWSIISGMSGE